MLTPHCKEYLAYVTKLSGLGFADNTVLQHTKFIWEYLWLGGVAVLGSSDKPLWPRQQLFTSGQ